jgi:hypothetical protein
MHTAPPCNAPVADDLLADAQQHAVAHEEPRDRRHVRVVSATALHCLWGKVGAQREAGVPKPGRDRGPARPTRRLVNEERIRCMPTKTPAAWQRSTTALMLAPLGYCVGWGGSRRSGSSATAVDLNRLKPTSARCGSHHPHGLGGVANRYEARLMGASIAPGPPIGECGKEGAAETASFSTSRRSLRRQPITAAWRLRCQSAHAACRDPVARRRHGRHVVCRFSARAQAARSCSPVP